MVEMTLAEVLRVDINTFDKGAPVDPGEEPVIVKFPDQGSRGYKSPSGGEAAIEAEVAEVAEVADDASRAKIVRGGLKLLLASTISCECV